MGNQQAALRREASTTHQTESLRPEGDSDLQTRNDDPPGLVFAQLGALFIHNGEFGPPPTNPCLREIFRLDSRPPKNYNSI